MTLLGLPPATVLALVVTGASIITAIAWAVIASTNLWPMLFGIYWKRTSPAGTLASMVAGSGTALIWLAFKNPFGIHGFIAGVTAALITIVLATAIFPANSEAGAS